MKLIRNKTIKTMSLLLILFLSSCGREVTPPPAETTDIQEAVIDTSINNDIYISLDEINITMKPFTTLNPLLVKDTDVANTLNLIYDTLFVFDSGMTQTPRLVEDYYYDIDSNTVVLELKKDVFFSNGDPLTNNDVIYSLNTLRNAPDDVFYKDNLDGIRSYNIVDDKIVLYLDKNYSFYDLKLNTPVISKKNYEGMNHTLPYGTGLFVLGKEEKYSIFSLEKNQYNKTESTINKINVEVLDSEEKKLVSFDKGFLDITYSNVSDWLHYKENTNVDIKKLNTNNLEFVGLNYDNPHIQKLKIREALSYAIPYNKTVDDIYLGFAQITNTGVNPSSWLYNEISQNNIFNIDYSKKLLASEGYLFDDIEKAFYLYTSTAEESIKDYLDLRVIVNEETPERLEFAKLYVEQLKKIGFNATLDVLPFEEYNQRLLKGDYDLFIGGIHTPENQKFMTIFQKNNPFNYNDATLEEKINLTTTSKTQEQYKSSMDDIQNYILQNKVFLPVLYKQDIFLCNGTISDAFLGYENTYYNIDKWDISQKYKVSNTSN